VAFQERLPLFPITTEVIGNGPAARLTIAGQDLVQLAEQYGTPLYVYDQATMDSAAEQYRQALQKAYPGESGVTYAGKAFLCLAAAQWVEQQGFWIDCTGAGELAIAAAAGADRSNLLVHGVNKSVEDLHATIQQAGAIVVDHHAELVQLLALLDATPQACLNIWLRIRPGVAVDTHHYRQTGQEESKFGFSPAEASAAISLAQQRGYPIYGIHFHQGSHFHDPSPIGPGLNTVLDLISEWHGTLGWLPKAICPGGGWGIAYHESELPHPPIEIYVNYLADALVTGCRERGLPLPRLQLEPGRSLVARAGVALYRVGALKQAGQRRWILIDGGMADNPRPALYGARYSALPVQDPTRPDAATAWFGGPYCESGDVLIHELPFPNVDVGEIIAVPASGAYHLMMGSNYNGARKPAVLWLVEGEAHLIQQREQLADLFSRDQPLPRRSGGQ
jgi:diaminopimelate decarboxylase